MSWPAFWNEKKWQSYLLWPLSKLVCWEATRRYRRFRQALPDKARQTDATVIVVGNVVVGGTGKTPFIFWLVKGLQQKGFKVGILSRGYGAGNKQWPLLVTSESHASECGDEPLMLARQTGCPVAVSPQRVEALDLLNSQFDCDFVISDDGLQHFALQRDLEVVLIDAQRRFGNGWCMPAGPLREPLQRITEVDFTVWNGIAANTSIPALDMVQKSAYAMQLQPVAFCSLADPQIKLNIEQFIEKYPLHEVLAVAGIGNPQRFFDTLQSQGLLVEGTPFPDHHNYQKSDLLALSASSKSDSKSDLGQKPLIMTEKDAVKCQAFAESEMHWWYLQIEPVCDDALLAAIISWHQQLQQQQSSLNASS